MTTSDLDIDAIVREVLRRLEQHAAAARNGSDAQARFNEPLTKPATAPAKELIITDRVVTLATLHKRLAGVQQVVVGQRAVVTPAVRDELRQRGIALHRAELSDS